MNKAVISPSRKSMHQVMSNSGFGDLTIHTEQLSINIPQSQITKEGNIKKSILKRAHELTRENIEYLESRGVMVYTGKGLENDGY